MDVFVPSAPFRQKSFSEAFVPAALQAFLGSVGSSGNNKSNNNLLMLYKGNAHSGVKGVQGVGNTSTFHSHDTIPLNSIVFTEYAYKGTSISHGW